MNTHNDGPGSLRQAILDSSSGDTIIFDPRLDGSKIKLTDNQLSIDKTLTIDASSLTKGITFVNGYGPNWDREDIQHVGAPGGAILNNGILVLTNCSLINNRTSNGSYSWSHGDDAYAASGGGGPGGAIANTGEVTATNCIFKHNRTGRGNEGSFVAGDAGAGGAIFNGESGTFTTIQCIFSHNKAANGAKAEPEGWEGIGGEGGAIANGGRFALIDCTLSDNHAGDGSNPPGEIGGPGGHGGAISNWRNLTIVGCTFANNRAGDGGGGQPGGDGGAVRVGYSFSQCTFVNNRAGDGGVVGSFRGEGGSGGAISKGFILSNCTIINNEAGLGGPDRPGKGGGVHGSETQISNCIISGNNAIEAPDIYGQINETGPNLISSEVPLLLAPLGDYGGPTHTMPPLSGSPVIDGGTTTDPKNTDQRGFLNFVDGDDSGTPAADLGAAEFQGLDAEFEITFHLDSDGDGITSGLERALGSNPFVHDAQHPNSLRIFTVDPINGEALLTFGYLDNRVKLRLLRSSNLVDFETVIADSDTSQDFELNPEKGLIEIRDEILPGDKALYRLEAFKKP